MGNGNHTVSFSNLSVVSGNDGFRGRVSSNFLPSKSTIPPLAKEKGSPMWFKLLTYISQISSISSHCPCLHPLRRRRQSLQPRSLTSVPSFLFPCSPLYSAANPSLQQVSRRRRHCKLVPIYLSSGWIRTRLPFSQPALLLASSTEPSRLRSAQDKPAVAHKHADLLRS